MAHSKYEVILEQDVANLGKSGELVRVRPGYARNYLIPNHIGVAATARNKNQIEHQQRAAIARAAKSQASAEAIAKRLSEVKLSITATAGDEDRLYGAVTSRDIAKALEGQGLSIDHKVIRLTDPIKRLGSYEITAKVGPNINATFKVDVVAKP